MPDPTTSKPVTSTVDLLNVGAYTLRNLTKINIILGKNGCGKSNLLRAVDDSRSVIANLGRIGYITPERSGVLTYEANVEQQILTNTEYLRSQRNRNQFIQFKEQTVAQYRRLFALVADEVETHVETDQPGKPVTLRSYLGRLNSLLDEIEVRREGAVFTIVKKGTTAKISAQSISSGESELIALGIECLVFEKEIGAGR